MYSFKGRQNNKNHAFPSKRCISNKKRVNVTHFTMKIIVRACLLPVIRKSYFLKNILAYCHRLLRSSCCFLNTNTAMTRQLIRTVRTLEAERWQVCGEVLVQGQRKMSQVLGAFGLLVFTILRPVLAWRAL